MLVMFEDSTPTGLSQELYYQVRKRLEDEARYLPQGVQGPFFNDDFEDVYFTLYSLSAQPGEKMPHEALLKVADRMQIALARVEGVKKVNLIGEQAQQLWIELDVKRISQMNLSLEEVQQAIASQLSVTAAGFVETAGPRLYLRTRQGGQATPLAVEQVRSMPLVIQGRSLHLGGIAHIEYGYEDPPRFLIRNKGEPAVLVGVVMQPATNGLVLEKNLQAFEQAYHAQLPLGVKLDKVTNQADAIHGAVSTFELKFVTALLVVLGVSLLTLGVRAGVVVALAVPLTLAMTFMFMYLQGHNFDRITLGALIISLGLLVDDAIIAIEMMLVKMAEGMDKVKAAAYAWQVTAAPMLVGTLVTVVGFLPIGLAQSRVGDYAGGIFWVLGITLIASWIVAVYFTPYLGVKLLSSKVASGHAHGSPYDSRAYRILRSVIERCVRHKVWVVVATVLLFVVSAVGMAKVVEKQFFPSSDRPELMVDVYLPEGSSLQATDAVTRRLEALINQYEEVDSLSAYVGQGAPRFFLALNPELPNPAFAKIIVVTHGKAEREALQAKLQRHIDAGEFSQARVRVHPLLFGPPVPWPVSFRVTGPNVDELRQIAGQVQAVMAAQPFTVMPHLQWNERVPVLRLEMDAERLALLGLTPQSVAQQLQLQLQGVPAAQLRHANRTVDVLVKSDVNPAQAIAELSSLSVRQPAELGGQSLPLQQLGTLVVAYEDPLLERRNREQVITVNTDLIAGMQPPVGTAKILEKLEPIIEQLPMGYRIEVGGSVEESSRAESSIKVMMPVMLLLMSLLIMLLVKSFSTLFMVLLTAPLGLIGAVAAMIAFNQPFGFVANLGLIGLGGILMRNTLILTGQIDDNLKQGQSLGEALVDATVRRARPVLLTALAAMLAFIPLTTSTFWGPMAYVLIGGIGVGTLITLLFLPALYALWFRVKLH
jgi:multidrug efflux pump subunit AcrB